VNHNQVKIICTHFGFEMPGKKPIRVHGGLLHKMWRLDTNNTSYAMKQLSKDIDLTNNQIVNNYELSEKIASQFIALGIPAVCAMKSNQYLCMADGTGFLVYPWVNSQALHKDTVSEMHALKIAEVLAKIHNINLSVSAVQAHQFHLNTNSEIIALIEKAEKLKCPFSNALKENIDNIILANESYHNALPILQANTVISHGDLDQKNVLWDNQDNPLLIDWECTSKVNPTYDIINTALYWSGITTNFNQGLFIKIINTYQNAGGILDKELVDAALYGTLSWIGWMVYNIERACSESDPEQKSIGISEVEQVLPTILRLQKVIPTLIEDIRNKI